MATIRELTARLGFEFDATPATRFDAAINRSKRNLEGLNKVKLTAFRTNLLGAFKVVGKAAAIAFGVAFAGALKFSDVAQALTQLRLQAKDSFEPIRSEIRNILADPVIGKLTTELDLLNGALAVIGKGIDPGVLIRTLKPALEFAIATRQSVSDVTQAISSFIAEANTELLVQLGIFDQAQLELLKVAGIDPGKQGLVARTAFIENALAQQEERTRALVTDLVTSGAVAQKQLANTFSELLKEIGEKTLPDFKKALNGVTSFLDTIRKIIRGDFTFIEIPETTPEQKQGFGAFSGISSAADIVGRTPSVTDADVAKFLLAPFQSVKNLDPVIPSSISGLVNNDNTSNITINAPITIQAGSGENGSMIARKVGEELRKVIGTAKAQSERTTVIRGNQ